jgi:hypothetical protein
MFQLHTPSLRMVRGVQAASLYELADLAEPIMRQPANKDWQSTPWPISASSGSHQQWTGTGFVLKDGILIEVECS